MASITFTGDPKAPGFDPAVLEMYQIKFPFGEPVEVADEAIVAKLRVHSHFTVDGAPEVEAPKPTKADNLAKARAAKAAKAHVKDIDA